MTDSPPIRAAVYLRISQDATGEGLGVSRQLEDCTTLADSLGWEIAEIYQDNDVSAVSAKPRPAYNRLLAAMQEGQIDAVVCWHADRLYRRMADLERLVKIVRETQTQIATVKAGRIDLTSDAGQMLAEILASVASYEGRAKATRWKRSWQQGREAGRPALTGSRLFGYTHESELIESEAAIARSMADDLLAGVPLLDIANHLEAAGIVTTRGTVWRTGTIRQYLANPRIAGWSTLKGEIVGEGQWEPVLDRETWEAVKVMLDARTRPYVPRKSLLNGLIFCTCGQRMVTSSQRRTRTYRCPNRPGMRGCGKVSGNAAPIEEVVESYAQARLMNPQVRERIAALRAEPLSVRQELAAIELRVTELEQQLDQPGVPVATILRAIERTRERQSELAATLGAHSGPPLPQPGEAWPEELQRRRALVDLVVRRVTLLPATKSSRLGFDPERVQIEDR